MNYPASPDSRIIAIETSGRRGCVAVARGDELLAEVRFAHGMRHAVELLPTIRQLLTEQQWRPGDIDEVYVSTGPGSFTGVRIGITVARTLHQAVGCRLVAVPTLDVLAYNAPGAAKNVVVLLDAKRGQVFAARYARATQQEAAANGPVATGPDNDLIRTSGPELVDPAQYIRQTPRPVMVLGEGVPYHRAALAAGVDNAADLIEADEALWPATAAAVHVLGRRMARRGEFAEPALLLPVYIRLAEAEEVWRKKHGPSA